jgi:hypothetical protein
MPKYFVQNFFIYIKVECSYPEMIPKSQAFFQISCWINSVVEPVFQTTYFLGPPGSGSFIICTDPDPDTTFTSVVIKIRQKNQVFTNFSRNFTGPEHHVEENLWEEAQAFFQCCGTVTIYYGSGSGSGSDF